MNLKNNSLSLTLTYLLSMSLPSIFLAFFKNNNIYYSAITLCGLLGMLCMLFFNNKKYPFNNQVSSPNKTTARGAIVWGLVGTFAALLLQRLSFLVETNLFDQSLESQNTAATLNVLIHYPYYIIFVILAAPIMEELVFRKVLYGNLSTLIGPIGAALTSSTLFSIAHQDGHFITYAVMGLTFCYIYTKTGRLRASMLSHVLMNTVIVVSSLL